MTIDKYGHKFLANMALLHRKFLLVIISVLFLIGPLQLVMSVPNSVDTPAAIDPIDDPELPPWGYYKGILPNPPLGGDIALTYQNASRYTQFVPVWGRPSPFYNLSIDLEGSWGQVFVEQLIRGNGMFPLVHMSFFGKNHMLIQHPSLPTSTLNTSAWRSEYIQSVRDVVNTSQPKYLSLGNEVNRWFEAHGIEASNDNGFQHFVSLYHEAYDAVKEISPDTLVFCTFAREIVAENREANMSVLELFDPDRLDMVVLTSYPFSIAGVNRVRDMPNDYYSSVFDHISSKPFGFSEVAWTSLTAFGGESEQASFIRNATSRLTLDQDLDLHLIGWNWLHDIGATDASGLMNENGTKKQALTEWVNNTDPQYRRENRVIDLMEDFGEYSYDLNKTFYDPDPWDELSYSVWNGTAYTNNTTNKVEASIVDGSLHMTSIENVTGITQLRIQVEDWSGLSNWTIIQVSLENVNDPPAIKNEMEVPPFSEGGSPFIDISYYIHDIDDPFNTLTIEVIEAPELNVSADLSVSPYMVLYAEEEDYNGETYVLFRVTDPHGAGRTINLTVRILPINDPPIINAPGEISFDEDTTVSFDLRTWVVDKDDDTLFWTVNTSDVVNISLEWDNDTLTIRPKENWFGDLSLYLNVTDQLDFSTYDIPVTVVPINDPPSVNNPETIRIDEDQVLYFDLSLIDPYDPDNDPLYWYLHNSTSLIRSVAILDNDTIRITPLLDGHGTGEFNLRVQDGRDGVAYSRFTIIVDPVNDLPLFTAPEDWSFEVELGDSKTIDLRYFPYITEDVDDPLNDLIAVTNYPLVEINGLVMEISVPPDSASDNVSMLIWVKDPHDAISAIWELTIIIVEDIDHGAGIVEVDNITFSNTGGNIEITANGKSGQIIWVVFTGFSGQVGSYMMTENPDDPGHYELEMDDPLWSDGEELYLHLSSIKGGPNESGDLPLAFTFKMGEESNGDDGPNPYPYLIGSGSILLLVGLLIIVIVIKNRKGAVSDFDYDSLLEE